MLIEFNQACSATGSLKTCKHVSLQAVSWNRKKKYEICVKMYRVFSLTGVIKEML